MNLSIYETLLKIAKLNGNKARSEALSAYQNDFPIKVILDLVYNPNIKFLLPETDPPFTPIDEGIDAQNVLKADIRLLKYCLNIPDGEQLRPLKREQMFIQLLESVDAGDAKLLLHVKNKKLPAELKDITESVVRKAFPGIEEKWKK
ncbi:MAG: hypothetical protein CMK23_06745 [Porticoccaceae bacterium]|nr:hypothetical protein [Porticoccaceae bacterium]|tara:strand:+ start:3572 stop:4012 length:441 start_codon:yes stop_codon:yes gene_type:complete